MSSHTLIEEINTAFATNGSIVEIGSARETAGSGSSTFYFAKLAGEINSRFYSIDFSPHSHVFAHKIIGNFAILSDGVQFLKRYPSIEERKISILYLDNFDVVYNEKHRESLLKRVGNVYQNNNEVITNERSAVVHLEQIHSAINLLAPKNVIIIDDTKLNEDGWWGKGALAVPYLQQIGYRIAAQSNDGVLLISPR